MSEQPTVLIVEDSTFFASILTRRIQDELDFNVDWQATYADAVKRIDSRKDEYLVALLDLTLPDAPNGEIVDYALQSGIPSIVFTGGFDNKKRNRFLSWKPRRLYPQGLQFVRGRPARYRQPDSQEQESPDVGGG